MVFCFATFGYLAAGSTVTRKDPMWSHGFQVSSALELLVGANVMSLTRVTLVTVRTNQLLVAPWQEHELAEMPPITTGP